MERLRQAFAIFRQRAAWLADEIAAVLPDFTVHSINHLDGLWRISDLICASALEFNPCEAFVLGGAFLVHDLGMALAGYPNGVAELERTTAWTDSVAAVLGSELGRCPTPGELASASSAVRWRATARVLRLTHAERAETLITTMWPDRAKSGGHYLIDDSDLRSMLGPVIGRIAHSHWWSLNETRDKLSYTLGAPVGFPDTWTVDALKLGCILRAADICHIDADRAPAFLRALRKPSGVASDHWAFQGKMLQPTSKEDAILFSAGSPFVLEEAAAWWLCLDTIRSIDNELRSVDSLLADTTRPRLALRRVAYVDDLTQLVKHIPTSGWLPVDTKVHVSDIYSLVRKLGGDQLYGDSLIAPLRELIQNGRDAVAARRAIEGLPSDWGRLDVVLRQEPGGNGYWLHISDTGVGMSSSVLTGALLDFGRSLWDSESVADEFPGLLSKGFAHVGKFGIGFFATFMLGDRVRVVSRRYDESPASTRVLEFYSGLSNRPILRPARAEEQRRDGGTTISILLKQAVVAEGGTLRPPKPGAGKRISSDIRAPKWTLQQICPWLCPAIDVDVWVGHGDTALERVVRSNDWLVIDGRELLKRITGPIRRGSKKAIKLVRDHSGMVRPLTDGAGRVVGRACLFMQDESYWDGVDKGAVVVGGLRSCALRNMGGVIMGTPLRASRDIAMPIPENDGLLAWSSEQAQLIARSSFDSESQMEAAGLVRQLGGETGTLPIGCTQEGFLHQEAMAKYLAPFDEIFVMSLHDLHEARRRGPVTLNKNVVATTIEQEPILIGDDLGFRWPEDLTADVYDFDFFYENSHLGGIVSGLSKEWNTPELSIWVNVVFPDADADEWIVKGVGTEGDHELLAHLSAIIQKPGR